MYNKLHDDIINSIFATTKCTVKQKQHGYPQLPTLFETRSEVLFWKLVTTTNKTGNPITDKALYIAEHIGKLMAFARTSTQAEAGAQLHGS